MHISYKKPNLFSYNAILYIRCLTGIMANKKHLHFTKA